MNAPTEDLLRETLFDDAGAAWADDDIWTRITTESERRTHTRRNRYLGGGALLATAAAAIAAFTFVGGGDESATVTPLTQPPVTAPLAPPCSAAGYPTDGGPKAELSDEMLESAGKVVAAAVECDEAKLQGLMAGDNFAYEDGRARWNGSDAALRQILADEAGARPVLFNIVQAISEGDADCSIPTSCNFVFVNDDNVRTTVFIDTGTWYAVSTGPATPITYSATTEPVPTVVQDKASAIAAAAARGDLNAVKAEAAPNTMIGLDLGTIDNLVVDDLEPIANALQGDDIKVASDRSEWLWCWSAPSLEHCVYIDANGSWTEYAAGD